MYLITIYWGFILLSLLTTFFHPPHAKDPIANQTLPSPAIPPADKLEVDVRSAALSLDFGSPVREVHISHLHTPSNQWAGLRDECHIARVAPAIILLASIVWLLWKYLGVDVQNGTENFSTNRGCTEAVSGPSGDSPLPNDPTKPQTRHERPASVVSADNPPYHALQSNEYVVVATPQAVTPRSNTFRKFVVAVCCLLPTWTWFRINQSEPAVVCLSIRPRGTLQRSLHKGSRDLSEGFLEPGRCIFLVVGVDTWGHLDAENDTEYLRQMFESADCGSSPQRYECLYGPDATFDNIRATVFTLLDGARAALGPSQLFILFTGTGDSDNAMCLPNDQALSDSDLKTWFATSSAGQTNDFNIGVLFDICRSAVSRLATVFQPIELAWSCSVGEFAYAICISEDKLIPRSIFLLAIFLAAHDVKVHDLDDCCFEAAFAFHIKQLSDLILFMYRKDHWGECSRCLTHQQCDAPVAQTPDLQQAGRVVASLGMLIATHFPQHASEVFAAVDKKMLQEEFPGRLCPLSVFHAQQSNKPTVKDES